MLLLLVTFWSVIITSLGQITDPRHIGCYKKDDVSQILTTDTTVFVNGSMTVDGCAGVCAKREFLFCGLLNGDQCLCGNSSTHGINKCATTGCCQNCTGDRSKGCGGYDAVDIYETVVDGRYLGCYKDNNKYHIFEKRKVSDSRTTDNCIQYCASFNYEYSGTQFKRECYCGNGSYDIYGRCVKEENCTCNTRCIGSKTEICGGSYAMSVYKTACREIRRWGSDCKQPCNCKDDNFCNIITGRCPEDKCAAGWQGKTCNTTCQSGLYGENCNEMCSQCSDKLCNRTNGHCNNSCAAGLQNFPECDKACQNGKYGENCSKTCSQCLEKSCNSTNGYCNKGCAAGLRNFPKCDQECQIGTYGENCRMTCTQCSEKLCDRTNGNCNKSCAAGLQNFPKCDQECMGSFGVNCSMLCHCHNLINCNKSTGLCGNNQCAAGYNNSDKSCQTACEPGTFGLSCALTCTCSNIADCDKIDGSCNGEPSNVGRIIGPVIAVCLVILLAGLTFYFRRKIRALWEKKKIPNVAAGYSQDINLYENTSNMTSGIMIKLENLETVVLAQKQTLAPFLKEYESLQKGTIKAQTGSFPGNKEKNRFKNIIPYDHARVKLTVIKDNPLTDYINASYMNGYNKQKQFIACQAPTGKTLGDFWRMIWEQNIEFIVILTELIEAAKVKCTKYWSDVGQCTTIGDITTETLDQEVLQDYTIRKIQFEKQHKVRTLTQFHYTAWKDFAVPDNGNTMLHFHRKVKQKVESTNSTAPIVVHCSAGVGRTGTFIALDYLLEQAVLTGSVDIFGCVENMRAVRPNMVNTKHQYEYLYDTMAEWYTIGLTAVDISDFLTLFNDEMKIKKQFQFLENMRNNSTEEVKDHLGNLADKKNKNRNTKSLPDLLSRVRLMTETETYGDYINAVFVDGYKKKNAFIANQFPLPNTRGDTWRMVWDYKLTIIVCFCEGEKDVFWPDANGKMEEGPFSIETKAQSHVSEAEKITAYDIVLTYQGQELKAVILTLCNFAINEEGIPRLLNLHDAMRKQQRSLESEMILVQCLYGVEMCGIFIATSNLLDMMNTEREVDIFQCVKRLRTHRPEFIQILEEYQFLYQIAHHYLYSVNYSNFLPYRR